MHSLPLVTVARLSTYDPAEVDAALERLLEPLGGIGAFVRQTDHVVLKPNLIKPAPPDSAVTTHPEIIRGVARLALKCGVETLSVTDSPGIGTATRCMKTLGIRVEDECFDVYDADDGVDYSEDDIKYHRLCLSKRMLDADVLINLPKLKTHGQMGMTAAVKNTFGCIVGFEKAQWHFRAGREVERFAQLVIQISDIVNPALHILDAVVAMEGNGPGSGTPRPLGVLLASTDPHALDAIACRIIELPPEHVATLAAAKGLGRLTDTDKIVLRGDSIADLELETPWKRSRPITPNFVGKGPLAPLVTRAITVKPAIDKKKCVMCGQCIDSCAPRAMRVVSTSGSKKMRIDIDRDRCISCFCCQEICPKGAITVKAGWLARLLGLGIR